VARPSLIALALVLPFTLTPRAVGSGAERGRVPPDGDIPATVTVWPDPLKVTANSSASRDPVRAPVILTTESDDFASGNGIGTVGGTVQLTLDPANAYDNVYTVHYFVTVSINGHPSQFGSATLVVAIETNDGSGWVERTTNSYNCGYPSGPPPYQPRTCSNWPHEQKAISVAGLGLNDNIRLTAKSFSTSNGAGGSFGIRGGDASGSNPETYNGVTYTTDVVPVSWAQSDDFASGNGIGAVGGTAGLNLDPGGALDNVYTVHYFVTVSINAHPSTYGGATLTVAIETNDGTGSGWIERAAPAYNCSYLSGPPPYPARTCTDWSHVQQAITVAGLGINDSIRLKAKSFTTSNGAGGSFAIRGGDGVGSNPETYNGVTYSTHIVRGVAVRAELSERGGFAAASGSQRFFVKNRGEVEGDLTLAFSCTGLTNCALTPTTLSDIQPGESRVATLTYNVGAAGTTGTGVVTVFDTFDNNTLRDSASVLVKAIGAPAPVVSTVEVNPGTAVDRDACLTIAAGAAAALECGDLRIIHQTPAIRTLNKGRVPTLLYNSAVADPYPVVAATVTLASGQPLPDSVEAVLTVGGVEKGRARWAGTDWTAGATRRIALAYSAGADTTNVYDYTFEAATIYLPSGRNGTTVAGKLIVVNRRGGGFGAGWWLSGLERLELLPDGSKLWVGGGGSARLYTAAGANLWVAATLYRPDTLAWDGAYFVHKVRGGGQVKFNASGQHVLTVNRLGHQTGFAYTSGRLTTITLPSQGGGQTYTLAYDGNNQLSSVTAPGSRVTTWWVNALRVDSIRDPDDRVVKFTYESPSSRRIGTRTDRRGTVTTYSYDAAEKVWRAHVNLQPDSIHVGFRARDVLGLATATPKAAIDTANAYTTLFGARQFTTGANYIAQETKFWLDRFGAPRRLVNPLGQETIVRREDGQWQAVATELQAPNGFLSRARYDRRGNIIASVSVNPFATGQDAVTQYHFDQTWDFADSVVTPTGRVTTMTYDATNGNRLWQQVGTDPARRVNFRYGNSLGLLSSTILPGMPPDSIEYNAMGNVSAVRTPKGFDTRYTADAIGRDTMIQARIDTLSAIYQTTIIKFDVFDRDTLQTMIGSPLGAAPAETVFVRKSYNATGQTDSLLRWARSDIASIGTIKTRWTYDLAGRPLLEIAPDGRQERWTYDPAGSVVTDSTRRGHILTMTYDALNRLSTRSLPAVSYASRNSNITWPAQALYPAYQIGAETQTFTYDPLGQPLTADNADAKIKRTYYPGGLLETDSLRIQTVPRDDWTRHVYGVRHTYDLDGRETSLAIPQQLGAAGLSASMPFAYEPQAGQLQSVSDLHGNPYTFTYNVRAELTSLTYPSQYQEGFTYDADGRLASDTVRNTGGTAFPRLLTALVRASTYRYDAQTRLLRSGDPNGWQDTLSLSYTGLGHIATSKLTQHGAQLYGTNYIGVRFATVETFTLDALGNRTFGETRDTTRTNGQVSSTSYSNHISQYQAATGRITLDAVVGGQTTYTYDLAGNTEFTSNPGGQFGPAQERATFYGADGTARAADWRWVANPTQVLTTAKYAFDEYRYDALGRRVWVWSKKDCTEEGNLAWYEAGECKTSLLRRTVWNGDQELAEIQMPGGAAANEVAVYENDVATVQLPNLQTQAGAVDRNQYFGRVLYTPGRGIDQPLAVTRVNYEYQHNDYGTIIAYKVLAPITTMPFWNRNGDAAVGVFTTGARRICVPPTTSPGDCVSVVWSSSWSAFDRNRSGVWDNWHGTVLESKRDKTNLSYNRNRYYDPQTGRFTQEDPLGLAGGLNLYGFAAGDPVNFGDPFGLCKVDIRAATLGLGNYHLYIVTTAPDNTRTEFRAGPSNGGPSSGNSQVVSSGSGGSSSQKSGSNSNSGNSSSPGSGPGGTPETDDQSLMGSLVGTTEPYNKDAVDWEEGAPPSVRVVDDDGPCDKYNRSFSRTLSALDRAHVPYNPFTANSNTAVRIMLARSGLTPVKPAARAPGWGTVLDFGN
jgi:RHS repeat-associated protein